VATQMIVRIDPALKERVSKLARAEGKSLSGLVRELLERYARERDISSYIDDLWNRIGARLAQNGVSISDIERVIAEVRSENGGTSKGGN